MKMDHRKLLLLMRRFNHGAVNFYPSWAVLALVRNMYFYSDFGSRLYVIEYLGRIYDELQTFSGRYKLIKVLPKKILCYALLVVPVFMILN